MKIHKILKNPWMHIIFLTVLISWLYSQAVLMPQDDNYSYQKFAETLINNRRVDFSIPGFHGADFFTAIVYYFTRSAYSVLYLDIVLGIANVFMIFLAVREMFRGKLENRLSDIAGVFAAYIYVLSPVEYNNALRGGHHTPLIFFSLAGLYLLFKNSRLSFLPMGVSYIVRPFSIAFFPLFIYKKRMIQFILSLTIPVAYVIAEYSQIGRVFIGIHSDLTPANVFSLKRFFFNVVYALQNYFSFHSYSFLNPLDPMDMAHLSPFITFLAFISILFYKKFHSERKLFLALAASAAIGLALPALIYHLDMWYLWTFNFLLIILAMPILLRWKRIVPFVAASFGFQFLYLYIATKTSYWQKGFIPLLFVYGIIVCISAGYVFITSKKYENTLGS